jgi:two-component system cell cycle response regulator DivK
MSGKILVADDDFDNRTIMQEALEASGYEVILATNGQEALDTLTAENPGIMLMDLSMPKINGWELARRVRETPALAGTVILAFTAHALSGDELKARAAGCDDYIAKPCLPKEVVAKVRGWLERR